MVFLGGVRIYDETEVYIEKSGDLCGDTNDRMTRSVDKFFHVSGFNIFRRFNYVD